MWTVIIIAVIALTAIVIKSIDEGDFIKGDHTHNFFMSMCCLLLTAIISLLAFGATLLLSIPIGASNEASVELVDTENYFLAEVINDKYVSITSDEYNYATLEYGVVHMREVKADDKITIKICEDSYAKDESPMIFIDHYRVGGTFFLDNFTFCNWLNESEVVTFYIPKGTVAVGAVAIN
jgi:hypothetical protein